MKAFDIISISILQDIRISIRIYTDWNIGIRKLGKGRYALDFTYISLIFELYYGVITKYYYNHTK